MSEHKATILVVDDSAEVRELLSDFLASRGYAVSTVPDGPSALDLLPDPNFDAILLDLLMPHMSGLSLLERLRVMQPDVPVIVITAIHEEEIGRRALRAGAVDFVTKPIDLAYLERTVAAAVARRR